MPEDTITNQEVLDVLAEECIELAHIISKIRRFGLLSVHPTTGVVNQEELKLEIADVLSMIGWVMGTDMVDFEDFDFTEHEEEKYKRVTYFREVSKDTSS